MRLASAAFFAGALFAVPFPSGAAPAPVPIKLPPVKPYSWPLAVSVPVHVLYPPSKVPQWPTSDTLSLTCRLQDPKSNVLAHSEFYIVKIKKIASGNDPALDIETVNVSIASPSNPRSASQPQPPATGDVIFCGLYHNFNGVISSRDPMVSSAQLTLPIPLGSGALTMPQMTVNIIR